jgi:tetratricopeptide (TPR) repeat protein
MTTLTTVSRIALSLALAVGIAGAGAIVTPAAVMAAEKAPTVAPAVGKPLQEAQAALKAGNPKEAVVKAQAAAAAAKSPYEIYVANEILGASYLKAGDYANLAKAFETSYNSGYMPPAEKTARLKVLTQVYYQVKNYQKAAENANLYLKENPADAEVQVLVAQVHYLQKDFKKASDALRAIVKASDAAGRPVKEDTLALLMAADYELKNDTAVAQTLEMLQARYPKPQYMKDLISTYEKTLRGGTAKTALDVQVVKFQAGLFDDAGDYTATTELALQDGLPGLAKKVMDKGVAAGVVGVGAAKDRENRMISMANTQAASDQKGLAGGEAEASKAKSGEALIKYGEAYWSYGMYDQAIAATQAGIAKGVADADDAKLRLGIAYLGSGKRPQALEAFKGITADTPAAKVAAMWKLLK